ncbi:hypothetical protein SALBM311S_08147 [Streptomyces alboniger]
MPLYVLPESDATNVGISTFESRGRETRVSPLLPTCSSIIESVRLPAAEPVCSFFFSSADMPARLSEPTMR